MIDRQYLQEFIKMHEYKLQSKIYKARARRVQTKLEETKLLYSNDQPNFLV